MICSGWSRSWNSKPRSPKTSIQNW